MSRIFLALATVFALFVAQPAQAGSGDKIVLYLDAAHGGEDKGGKSATGLRESDLMLQLAQSIQANAPANVTVVLTRSTDQYVTFEQLKQMTKDASGKAYFVSLHAEQDSAKTKGFVIMFNPKNQIDGSVGLTRHLMHNLNPLGPVNMQPKWLAVLDRLTIPGVALSVGNLSMPADLARIQEPSFGTKLSTAIFTALGEL